MARLPHSVFKHILPFNVPRYEQVRNGDPYMATPTRVWYTKSEHAGQTDPYEDADVYTKPSGYHWGSPAIARRGPEHDLPLEPWLAATLTAARRDNPTKHIPVEHFLTLSRIKFTVLEKYYVVAGMHREKDFKQRLSDLAFYCGRNGRLGKLSLQCGTCGPDLELYEMMRRRRRQ